MATTTSTEVYGSNAKGEGTCTTTETTTYANGAVAEVKRVVTFPRFGFKYPTRLTHSVRQPGGPKQRVSHGAYWDFRAQQNNAELDAMDEATK